jgi:hypothetical protein
MFDYEDSFEQKFEWEVVYSVTTKEGITRPKEDKKIKPNKYTKDREYYEPSKYNVFDKKDIYEKFSRIDTTNLQNVDDFINEYGILGLNIENKQKDLEKEYSDYRNIVEYAAEERDWKRIDALIQTIENMNLIRDNFYVEPLDDFIREVKIMRLILTLNKFETIKTSEEKEVKTLIKELEELAEVDFMSSDPKGFLQLKSSFISLNYKKTAWVTGLIAHKMRSTTPRLEIRFEKNKPHTYIKTWKPISLLGCMYTMLFNDLSMGHKTDICQVCGKPVVLRDKRSEPYHTDCQGRKHTANTRERQTEKAKEYITNKYYDKPNVLTKEILIKEKDYIHSEIGKSALFNITRINKWLRRTKEED